MVLIAMSTKLTKESAGHGLPEHPNRSFKRVLLPALMYMRLALGVLLGLRAFIVHNFILPFDRLLVYGAQDSSDEFFT